MHARSRTSLKRPARAEAVICLRRENPAILAVFPREVNPGGSGTLIAKAINDSDSPVLRNIRRHTRDAFSRRENDDENQ
jgi:hypothetical protein